MANKIHKKLLLTSGILIIITTIISMSYAHEIIHQKIFKEYGINSKIENFTTTIPQNECKQNCEEMNKEHTENDIIGYPIQTGITGIMGLILTGMILWTRN